MKNKCVDVICSNELTTFPTRKDAILFFYRCMSCSEGAERERYLNIYLGLTSSKSKMVHDEDWNEPIIYRTCKFVGDHCEDLESLPKPMKYKEYLLYKREQEKLKNSANKFYELGYRLTSEQKKHYESKGLFCYDLRCDSLDEGFIVEKNVLINHVGSLITTKDLELSEEKRYVELDFIEENFEEMSYEEFCKIKHKEEQDELTY